MTEIHSIKSKLGPALTLLTAALAFAGVNSLSSNAATTDPHPMCAKFLGDQTLLGSDGLGDYCQTGDVLCGSAGKGFVLTTDYTSPSRRKAWLDLKHAEQYNNPPVSAKSLPANFLEVELLGMTPNNPNGTCIPNLDGSPLDMVPGETYLASLRLRIADGKNYYDLRFGQAYCEAEPSPCPVVVTAMADLDPVPDGIADMWTIEPASSSARAILFKGKPNPDSPVSTKIGSFKVPFKLVFVRAQFAAALNGMN